MTYFALDPSMSRWMVYTWRRHPHSVIAVTDVNWICFHVDR